jgi:hypothetical protein
MCVCAETFPSFFHSVCIQDLFTDAEEMKNVYEVLNVLVGKCKLVEQLLVNGTYIRALCLPSHST